MLSHKTIRNLPNNNRFYILLFSFLLSIFLLSILRNQIPSEQLFYIRLEQIYGLISIVYLYCALIISPLQKIIGEPNWMKNVVFARRAIGVSAAYFAFLHAAVALWGQIGGFGGLGLLPGRFTWALIFGVISLAVLFLMAATSFDKVIKFMTFRKWKWLHRFVYMAGVLIILHVWMIGTYIAYSWVQLAAFIPITIFIGLESWRIVTNITKRLPELKSKEYFWTLVVVLWAVWSIAILSIPALVQNYHSEHHSGDHAEHGTSNE